MNARTPTPSNRTAHRIHRFQSGRGGAGVSRIGPPSSCAGLSMARPGCRVRLDVSCGIVLRETFAGLRRPNSKVSTRRGQR